MDKTQLLSPHFMLGEFLHAGVSTLPDHIFKNLKQLAHALEDVRVRLGNAPIIITSGYRTEAHNREVGGAKNSYHLQGLAADIIIPGFTARQVQVILKDWPGGMGLAESFTHLDIRPYKARFHY